MQLDIILKFPEFYHWPLLALLINLIEEPTNLALYKLPESIKKQNLISGGEKDMAKWWGIHILVITLQIILVALTSDLVWIS